MIKIDENREQHLIDARHKIGLYSIRELCIMFNCHRFSIDNALNAKRLRYVSPNRRDRYIYIGEFMSFMETNFKTSDSMGG